MELRAIRTDSDLDMALAEIEQYFDARPEQGTAKEDRFDILTDLINAYESREYPIEELT
jgi:HTH-type transcriptional regulator/antitoxin HigA